MRYLKLLLIPVVFVLLVLAYSNIIHSLTEEKITIGEGGSSEKSRTAEVLGVGQAVTVQITRATKPYLFGIVDLPTYVSGIGNLKLVHTVFFWSLYILASILTIILIIIERRNVYMVSKNPFSKESNIWMRIAKSLGIGALFALVAFLISGDASSLPIGLLVAYIEFRMAPA